MLCAANTVVQPIGHMLTGNTQGCAIFHQANIIDVEHLRATHALLYPAHHIAQQALSIVVQLQLDLFTTKLTIAKQWNGEDIIYIGLGALSHLLLHRVYINLMVVHSMQCGRGWRWHPGSVSAGFCMAYFNPHHIRHIVWDCPHALANLSLAFEPAGQAYVYIAVFVGSNPGHRLKISFQCKGARVHAGVNLIPSAIEKSGVNKYHAPFGSADALFEID